MADKAIEAIRDIALKDLSFQWFRSAFRADNGLKDTLYYGHAVIDSTEKLDQYLHTYGPMIESQWKCAAHFLDRVSPPTLCIDYGCGQGLAGLLVSDIRQVAQNDSQSSAHRTVGRSIGSINGDLQAHSSCCESNQHLQAL